MCSLVLLLTISLQLAASFRRSKYLSSLLVFCLLSHRNHVKESSGNFKNPKKVGLTVLKKISKWQHKFIRDYKPIKLVSYFLNNVVKTRLYGLKISENIEFEHIFQSKLFFHLSSNLQTSCLNDFNYTCQISVYCTNCCHLIDSKAMTLCIVPSFLTSYLKLLIKRN